MTRWPLVLIAAIILTSAVLIGRSRPTPPKEVKLEDAGPSSTVMAETPASGILVRLAIQERQIQELFARLRAVEKKVGIDGDAVTSPRLSPPQISPP